MLTLAVVSCDVWRKVASLIKGPATLTSSSSLTAAFPTLAFACAADSLNFLAQACLTDTAPFLAADPSQSRLNLGLLPAFPSLSALYVASAVDRTGLDSSDFDAALCPFVDPTASDQSLLPSEATLPAGSAASREDGTGTWTGSCSATAPSLELPPPPRILGTNCPQGSRHG